MATETTIELATLRFDGKRFEGHVLDVECTQELIAYRDLVLECAKSLWRAKYPDRARLPNGFGDGFRLQFDRLDPGSAAVPLQRVRPPLEQGELELGDEFDEAVTLIDQAIAAANTDDLLPDRLPSNVIPLFRKFGRTLRDDEVLFTRGRDSASESAYTTKARARLENWVEATYEDKVDVTGEVRMANVGPGRFALQVRFGEVVVQVEGKYSQEHEARVLGALREHETARLCVRGVGEFGTADRMLKRFARVDEVELAQVMEMAYDDSAPPIWEQLGAIGRSSPEAAWESVPSDLSARIDELVYGHGEGSR